MTQSGRGPGAHNSQQGVGKALVRRGALKVALAAGAALLLPGKGLAGSKTVATPYPGLPSPRELHDLTTHMVRFGQRYAGTKEHNRYIDFLASEFAELGLAVTRNGEDFENWEAKRWELAFGPNANERLPVSAYYTYSGETPAQGVEAEVVWLDGPEPEGRDVQGRIAVFRRQFSATEVGKALAQITRSSNTSSTPFADSVIRKFRPSRSDMAMDSSQMLHMISTPALTALREAGAVGVVIVEDGVPPISLEGAYVPFHLPHQGVPALIVNTATGKMIERSAGKKLRLTLEATRRATRTDHVAAVIPGMSDEVIVLSSHTDGPNAIEENGSIGVLALARHLASLPREQLPRTIVLACVTGHMSPVQTRDLGGWFAANPDIQRRTVACIAIEHLGAMEWTEDMTQSRPTGRADQGMCYVSKHRKLEALVVDAFQHANLDNTVVLEPTAGWIPGIAGFPNTVGIPTVAYIAGPPYLMAWDKADHMDKFDAQRMHDELTVMAKLLHSIGAMSIADLRESKVPDHSAR